MHLRPLSDDDISAIVTAEYDQAVSWNEEVAEDVDRALDYYYGRPMGDEVEGQSSVVTRDVMEVVDGAMPLLVRMMCSDDDLVTFEPANVDVDGADVATKYVRHVVFNDNDGFRLIHDCLKDGLLSKVGAFKWQWVEKKEPIDRDYRGLGEMELALLLEDIRAKANGMEVSIYAQQRNENGTLDVIIRMMRVWGQVEIECIPPEELLITRGAKVLNNSTRYAGHRTVKTRSDLVAMGVPLDVVLELPTYDGDWTSTYSARTRTGDTAPTTASQNKMAEEVEYIENYVLMDMDGDGITERVMVCMSNGKLLKKQPMAGLQMSAWSPVRMSHRVIGMSLADLATDIQRIMTALTRGTLNNIYNVNAGGRMFVQGDVNYDDLLTVRMGGIVRGSPSSSVTPLPSEYIGDRSMAVMDMVRNMRNERTGVRPHTQGENAADLHDSATVANKMVEQAIEKIELYARMFAEFALKPMWAGVLDLCIRYQDDKRQIRVTGKTLDVDPSAFKERYGLRVKVGLGIATKEQRMGFLVNMLQSQTESLQSGMPLTNMQRIYNTTAKLTEMGGFDPKDFWVDPSSPEGVAMAEAQANRQPEEDPLVKAELVKANLQAQVKNQELADERAAKLRDFMRDMTELELKYSADVPGSAV